MGKVNVPVKRNTGRWKIQSKKIFYKKVKKVMIFFICLIETGLSL